MSDISTFIRERQEADPVMGLFFKALHTFVDRTLSKFFAEDDEDFPQVTLAFGEIQDERLAYYQASTGWGPTDVITIDVSKLKDGEELLEIIAHELVHAWQNHLGYEIDGKRHTTEFHEKMLDYGIATEGPKGRHSGTIGEVWSDWLKRNEDLGVNQYTIDVQAQRPRLYTWVCPVCGFSFLAPGGVSVRCENTSECFEEMVRES